MVVADTSFEVVVGNLAVASSLADQVVASSLADQVVASSFADQVVASSSADQVAVASFAGQARVASSFVVAVPSLATSSTVAGRDFPWLLSHSLRGAIFRP